VINQEGIGYKNFVPVTQKRQAAAHFPNPSHVRLKQTARNPKKA